MKTKEFIKRVEELGYVIDTSMNPAEIMYMDDIDEEYNLAFVDLKEPFVIDTVSTYMDRHKYAARQELFDLIVEYARTPIEEREEVKKYYLRHKWLEQERVKYLSCNVHTLSYGLGLKEGAGINFKTRFTLKEIEEIKEKYNTDLSDFELVEVEE